MDYSIESLFSLQLPDMRISPENQAHINAGYPQDRKQESGTAAFPGANQPDKEAVRMLCCHNRPKDLIHQQTSQEVSHCNGEELKRCRNTVHKHRNADNGIDSIHGCFKCFGQHHGRKSGIIP